MLRYTVYPPQNRDDNTQNMGRKDDILQGKRILVVEDNVINQMVVRHSVATLGGETDIACEGAEAIEKLKTADYDLVLMDIQMPVMDGYETTRFIRNQLKSNVPVIAMTAFAQRGEDEKCYEGGMNGYVSKPFTLESLYTAIRNVFEGPIMVNDNPNVLSNNDASVDISMLYEIVGNDDAYIEMMIQTFLENLPVTIQKMEAAHQQQDWETLHRSAHYAKSSLSVIKIADMYTWVSTIEMSAKKLIDLEAIGPLLLQVKNQFAAVEKILTDKFSLKSKSSLT